MMKWEIMRPADAKQTMDTMIESNNIICTNLNHEYSELRILLLREWKKSCANTIDANGKKSTYIKDITFALGLYQIFRCAPFKISMRQAADAGFWKYIAVCVIPDVIAERFGVSANLKDHTYKQKRRIYPLSLWWYIHLTWQGNRENTYKAILYNTTDTILNLVERSGTMGYNVDLYRSIIKHTSERKISSSTFRKIMVLNTAYSKTVEPDLFDGNIDAYVRGLFDYFEKK